MATFKLDGRDVEFQPGEMVIEAAARAGVNIPYYCYHPDLSRPANCRMCLVELKGAPKLIPSCQQPVNDKMDVLTTSERVRLAQADVMEFLLVNHPLDCPICDQAGECKLQQYSYLFGKPMSAMEEPKVKLEKRKVLGPHVVLDQERCIACTRCVRFTQEITKTGELTMIARSNHNTVDVHPDRQLDNAYSGCVVDMCPVGALTDRQFRFTSRVWYVQPVVTTCTLCSRGCSIAADRRGERHAQPTIKRIRARRNPAVNGSWICDVGRYGHHLVVEGNRPVRALSRAAAVESGPAQGLGSAAASSALVAAAGLLRQNTGASGWLGVLASGAETLEELSALEELARAADPQAVVVVPEHADEPEDELLRRTDHLANRRGARLLGMVGDPSTVARRRVLIACDADARPGGGLDPALLEAAMRGGAAVIALAAADQPWLAHAQVVLPLANAYEKAGTVVNFDGVVQRLHRVLPPPGDCRPAHHVAGDLAEAAGLPRIESDTATRLRALAAGPLRPLDVDRLDEWGARLPQAPGGEVQYVPVPLQLFTAAPKAYAEGEYLPFMHVEPPPPAIHVGAGVPPRNAERRAWFGPDHDAVDEEPLPGPEVPAAGAGRTSPQ